MTKLTIGWLQPCSKYYNYHLGEERNFLVQQLNSHPNPMTSRKLIPNNTNEFEVDTSIVKHPDKNTAINTLISVLQDFVQRTKQHHVALTEV